MTPSTEIDARYRPGEDALPLVRALGAGLVGAILALLADAALAAATGRRALLPALLAGRLAGQESAMALGIAAAVAISTAAGLVYAYGQIRRFVPGPPWVKGLLCGLASWLVTAPAVLPAAAAATSSEGSATSMLAGCAIASVQTLVAAVVCGAVIGALNPPREF